MDAQQKLIYDRMKQGYMPPPSNSNVNDHQQRTNAINYIAFSLGEIEKHLAKLVELKSK